jgi:hypothetical protein
LDLKTTIDICGNKKEAKQRHNEAVHDPNTIRIYTDGSGIDGQIRAAAVSQTTSETRKQYIGTESSNNVYAAELAAIKLSVDILQAALRTYDKCVIYTDSQPAIKVTAKPGQQSGQSILTSVIDAFEALQYQQFLTSKFHWYGCLATWTLPGTKRQTRLPRRRLHQGIQTAVRLLRTKP